MFIFYYSCMKVLKQDETNENMGVHELTLSINPVICLVYNIVHWTSLCL